MKKGVVWAMQMTCVLVLGVTPPARSGRAAEPEITFESLLDEMLDRDAVARLPEPAYTCRQFSSYDRRSVSPEDARTWFANRDWSHFLREENNHGRKEWVMMDAAGPGCVVRIWSGGPKPKGALRFYLNGSERPVIEGPTDALIGGKALVGPPLSAVRARGLNLHLPIPYAKRCKITYDGPSFWQTKNGADRIWFNINYRTYAPDTRVKSFTRAGFDAAKDHVERVQRALLAPSERIAAPTSELRVPPRMLKSGKSLQRTQDGAGAVRKLSIQIKAKDLATALRGTVLIIEFDGEQTVWCPVGDFFGSGVGLNPFKGWWRTVEKSGRMTCYWPMPYQKSCAIKLENLGKDDVEVALRAAFGPWAWDDRSMHFHATWRQQFPLATQPRSDWNYVEVAGKGAFVGDTLAVMNPVRTWWGEGDEKIYVDGEKFPSHFGTGTEDYYGYAWGNTTLFEAPFHAQPRVDGPGNLGHTTVTRSRCLDAIPFNKSFRLDMEVWHWRACRVAYAATTYWYARPGARSNRAPAPAEATRQIPGPPEPLRVKGALEGERLKILAKTGGITELQKIARYKWSGDCQLWWRDGKPGDKLVLAVPVKKAGRYRLVANLTKAFDYGIMQFYLDGEKLGDPIDLYNPKVVTTGPKILGTRDLTAGEHKLRVEIAGANARAKKRYMLGLDYVKLEAAD